MQNLLHQLEEIGLSENEAMVYFTLLQLGTRGTSLIAKKAKMNRGTVYFALHSLLEKGLVVKSVKRRVQQFTALNPQFLLSHLERREQEIRRQKGRLGELVVSLMALIKPHGARPSVEFFEGADGARAALEDTLSAEDPLLRAFLSLDDIIDFVGIDYFDDYTSRRIATGHKLNAIRTLEKDKAAMRKEVLAKRYRSSKKEGRTIRYVGEELAFPITMYIYDNKILIISSEKESFALLIISSELSTMQKQLFDLIWNTSADHSNSSKLKRA